MEMCIHSYNINIFFYSINFPFIEYFKAKKYKLSIDNIDSFLVSDGEKLLAINIEVNLSDHKFLFYCN